MLVTQTWMDIIEYTREPKKLENIGLEMGYDNNHISRILNHLIGLGCIVKKGYHFQSVKKDYVISTHNKIKTVKALLGDKVEIPPIHIDVPDLDTCKKIKKLNDKKLTRSEIAKQLNIPKQQVLWALSGVSNG